MPVQLLWCRTEAGERRILASRIEAEERERRLGSQRQKELTELRQILSGFRDKLRRQTGVALLFRDGLTLRINPTEEIHNSRRASRVRGFSREIGPREAGKG